MVNVVKADGTIEPFSEEKVIASIRRAHISPELEQKAIKTVKEKLYENIPTYDIYGIIADALYHSHEPFSKARYSLKQAIMLLGPTGYPFEDFIGKVLEERGYSITTRQVLDGKCVKHEIDVVAEKNAGKALIEAKFHNNPGSRTDIQVALYVNSRFLDLKDKYRFNEAWVITNTKTTIDANAYADCVGMKMISWNYPERGSLRDMIEEAKLHPITMLTSLDSKQKAMLLANSIIMCKDIKENKKALSLLSLSKDEREQVLSEVSYICDSIGHQHA